MSPYYRPCSRISDKLIDMIYLHVPGAIFLNIIHVWPLLRLLSQRFSGGHGRSTGSRCCVGSCRLAKQSLNFRSRAEFGVRRERADLGCGRRDGCPSNTTFDRYPHVLACPDSYVRSPINLKPKAVRASAGRLENDGRFLEKGLGCRTAARQEGFVRGGLGKKPRTKIFEFSSLGQEQQGATVRSLTKLAAACWTFPWTASSEDSSPSNPSKVQLSARAAQTFSISVLKLGNLRLSASCAFYPPGCRRQVHHMHSLNTTSSLRTHKFGRAVFVGINSESPKPNPSRSPDLPS